MRIPRYNSCLIVVIFGLLTACQQNLQNNRQADVTEADSLMELAMAYADSLQLKRAIEVDRQALELYMAANDSAGMSDCYSDIGALYHHLGDFSSSIEAISAGLAIDEARHDVERMSSSYNNLAAIYLAAKQPESGRGFILKAIEAERSLPEPKKLSIRYGIASEIYVALDSLETALDYARQAFSLDSAAHDTLRMGRRLSQMGDVFQASGDYARAEQAYMASMQFLKAVGEVHSLCIDYKQLAQLCARNHRNDEAMTYFQQSVEMAHRMNNHLFLQQIYKHMAELIKEKNPRLATVYLERAFAYKDSVFSQQTTELTTRFKANYDYAEQQHVIEQQKAELAVNRAILYGGLVALLLLLSTTITLFLLLRQRTVKEKALRNLVMVAGTPFEDRVGDSATEASDEQNTPDRDFINQLTTLIRENIGRSDLNAVTLAPMMQMTRHQLTAKVRSLTGLSANNFITRVRLDRASQLLRSTSMNISEIAWDCGFQDLSYFGRVFKEIYGQTPTNYRRQ